MKKSLNILYLTALYPCLLLADGAVIDKVYHPYVQSLEREFEWRQISANDTQIYRLGIGRSITDRLFVEGYLIAKDVGNHLQLDAYEIEAKWQLTEQGEYTTDWGVLFELEKEQHDNTWEASAGLLMEKEWGRWIATANVKIIYEWGAKVKNELEVSLASQVRYRYKRYLEPAIELYSGEQGVALGPVLMGDIGLATAKKLHWEFGSILGFDSKAPSNTWRLLMEYEF